MTYLNQNLIEQQGLHNGEITNLEMLHAQREVLFERMRKLNPSIEEEMTVLKENVNELEQIEFAMQRNWRFSEDASKHSWWFVAPHCVCPKLDNNDIAYGRIISEGCPLHS